MTKFAVCAAAALVAPLALAVPATAQETSLTDRQVELYSEMWAMAGVCNQLQGFYVKQDDLADRLNLDLADVEDAQFAQVADLREQKLDELREDIETLRAMNQGSGRVRGVDETTATLMTRCNRLAGNTLASAYFGSPMRR